MRYLSARDGVSTIEYVVILIAFAIGVPLLVAGLTTFIEDRTCEAGALVGGDCVITRVLPQDQTEITYRGIPVSVDLAEGARTLIERVSNDGFIAPAGAQSLDRDYIAPRDEIATEDRPLLVGFRVVEAGPVRVMSVQSAGRSLSVSSFGTGRLALDGTGATFHPQGDFDILRSGEEALVAFPFILEDPRGNRGSAQARIRVLGFHADDDILTDAAGTYRDVPVTIDVLANDHLPGARHEVTITSLSQPQRGSAAIVGDTIRFTPGPEHSPLRSGDSDTVSFTYTIRGPMGVTDNADVIVVVNGFSAEPDSATTRFDAPVLIDVLANDHFGRRDEMTLVSVTAPSAGGTAAIVGGQVRFDPTGAFAGMPHGSHRDTSFSYTVRHVSGALSTATVSVRVLAPDLTFSWTTGPWGGCSASPSWMAASDWSACSATCGGGTQTRQMFCANTSGVSARAVECRDSNGNLAPDALCSGIAVRPVSTQVCANTCPGSSVQTQACNTQPCAPPHCRIIRFQSSDDWPVPYRLTPWNGVPSDWDVNTLVCGDGHLLLPMEINGMPSPAYQARFWANFARTPSVQSCRLVDPRTSFETDSRGNRVFRILGNPVWECTATNGLVFQVLQSIIVNHAPQGNGTNYYRSIRVMDHVSQIPRIRNTCWWRDARNLIVYCSAPPDVW